MTKEERQQQQEQRQADRLGRIANAQTRQRESDIRTYVEGSALLSTQKSSRSGDARGGIWDVSVDNYKQPNRNETGQNDSVNDGQGIDSIGAGGEPATADFGSVGNIHAFQLVSGGDALYVRQGTVGSTIPTITGGSELAAEYTDNELSIPGTGTREYWIKVTLDADSFITAVTIETSEPSADSATQAKLLLGSVETDSGDIVAFNSNLSGSQALASCGSTHYFGVV